MQPSAQQPGQKIDQELNLSLTSTNATISRLNEIQRDDGKIRISALDLTELTTIAVPPGGTTGQVLAKTSNTSYATAWTTLNLTQYVEKANNLSDLANAATARTNLGLGTLAVVNDAPSDGSKYARRNAAWEVVTTPPNFITSVTAPLAVTTGNLTVDLSAYLPVSGGTLDANATIDASTATTASTFSGDAFSVQLSGNPSENSILQYGGLQVQNFSGTMAVTPTGLTFPNSSTQTIAFPGFNNTALTGSPTAPTAALADNDTSIATTAFVQQELLSGTANARNLEVYVRNQTGSTIPIGSIVYINGATGNRPTVTLAQANNDVNSAQTIGFTKTAIANNGFGFVIVRGELENLNTNSLTEGVQLYLSPTTAGAYTITKPSAPQHLVYVGIVIRAHPTQGVILVSVQNGYELNELHDVALASEANLDLLTYESSTDLWKNKSFSTLGLAPLASPAFTGNVTINSSTGAALFIEQTGTGNILTLHDQATDTNFVAIDQNGKINTVVADATTAGLNVPHTTVVPTTPVNGDIWTTTGGLFVRINGSSNQIMDLTTTQTVAGSKTFTNQNLTLGNSTIAGTIAIGTGAVVSGSTRVINIGTASAAGSTNNVNIGGGSGTTNVTLGGSIALSGPITSVVNNISLGTGTAASIYAFGTGATTSGLTKAVTIGTGGLAGSTTNITVGSTTGTSTTTLQGITNGITQTVGDNSTKLATTAFVTAAVPAFATNAQTLTGTSTTTAINPATAIVAQMNTNVIQPNLAQFVAVTSGAGAATSIPSSSNGFALTSPTTVVGHAMRYVSPLVRGVAITGNIQWTRPAGFCARLVNPNFNTFQTQAVARVSLGKSSAALSAGAPTARGIAVSYGASAANVLSALVLEVHNGTSLTTVTSSFTPTMNISFDVAVYSDGAGNVTLYANGSQVATTSAGPSTNGGATYETHLLAEIQNTSTATQTSYVRIENMKFFVN